MTMSPTDLFTAILAGLLGASLGVGAWIAWHSLRRLRARATHLEAELAAARDSLLGLSHFKDVLDRTLDALYIFTASDLTLIYVNQGCATQLDFQIEDLLGRSLRVIKADGGDNKVVTLHPAIIQRFRENLEKMAGALSNTKLSEAELAPFRVAFGNAFDCVVVHPTGKRQPVEVTPYARISAIMGVDIVPKMRTPDKVLEDQGLTNLVLATHG